MLKSLLLISVIFLTQNILAQQSEKESADSSKINQVNQDINQNNSRDYVIYPSSGLGFILSQVFKPNSGAERKDKGYDILLKAAKNFGMFEVGPSFYKSYSEQGDAMDSEKSQYYGIFARYNFIENKAGVKLVPFIGGEIKVGEDVSTNSGNDTTVSNSKTYMSAGVEYFPLNDYLSLALGLVSSSRKYDIKSNSNDYEYSSLSFSTDFKVYF